MTFKPTTYLISFTLFVMLFMALGGYVGYGKMADHFLAQAFLEATPINVQVQEDPQGRVLRWEDQVALPGGGVASILASSRPVPISIHYSGDLGAAVTAIPLAANERTEDLRLDKAGRYLYARVLATSNLKAKETTWLCKYDLQGRKLQRRASTNPLLLPAPFRP